MDYIHDLSQVSGDGGFEYPDPETAQSLPWPDITPINTWDTALGDASSLSETTSVSLENGNNELDPNVHFANLDQHGQPLDAEYFDQVSLE